MNKKGFTMIELLAVIVIIGILLLVGIPSMTKIVTNSRKDSFIETAMAYTNEVRNLWSTDILKCGENGSSPSMLPVGEYYVVIDSKDGVLLQRGGKSSWGNKDVSGYVKVTVMKDSNGIRTENYNIALNDGVHGIKEMLYGDVESLARDNVTMKLTDEELNGFDTTRNMTCVVKGNGHQSKETLGEQILANETVSLEQPDFSTNFGEGLFESVDNIGSSYYYRGININNHVKFAGYYWRIVRINGDGSVRLIFSGKDINKTSDDFINDRISYHDKYDNPKYVNYTNSETETALNKWFNETLKDKYSNYLTQGLFCNDRSLAVGDGISITEFSEFKSKDRIKKDRQPILTCNKDDTLFLPIGLLTADELALAGGTTSSKLENNFYLKNGNQYFTMTPYYYNNGHAFVWYIDNTGEILGSYVTSNLTLRPVINVKSDLILSGGDGSIASPYTFSL